MKKNNYNTKQKELLLDFLKNNGSKHVNVQEISSYLINSGNPMGTSTIYRQLERMVEQGTVRKYVLDGRAGACYQYVSEKQECGSHFHLKCVSCGTLFHLDCNYLSEIDKHIYEHHGFTVYNSKTVFYGICGKCNGEKT